MNRTETVGVAQSGQKRLIFIVFPLLRIENIKERRKSKQIDIFKV